jgi:hypothetical protein
MATFVEVVVFVGVCVLLALGGMLLVRRSIRLTTLEAHKEIAGFVYATLGVAYAVLLTFVAVAVWEQHRAAEETANREATTVATLFHLADGFDPAVRSDIQETLVAYTRAVIDDEWPLLARGEGSVEAWNLSDHLWQHYTRMPMAQRQSREYTECLSAMRTFYELRNQRLLDSRNTIPSAIAGVLIAGGVITIAFTYLFGVRSLFSQSVMTTALAIVIGSSLFLIYALDNPFAGSLKVRPDAFEGYLQFFERRMSEQ